MAVEHPTVIRRRFYALLAIGAILGCGLIAASARRRVVPLTPGEPFPALDLVDWRGGSPVVLATTRSPTVVILVHSGCHFCAEQLDELSEHFSALPNASIIILTGETAPPADHPARWPRLASDSAVRWVRGNPTQVLAAYRTLETPSLFIYDRQGRLRRSFRGLTQMGTRGRFKPNRSVR